MRNPRIYVLLMFLLFFSFLACTKKSGEDGFPENQYPPIFQNHEEAGNALGKVLTNAGQGEQLVEVENIVFLESGNKSYALVFYLSNLGHRNIMFEHTYQGTELASAQTYQCFGTSCDCKVATSIGENGQVSISCSCTGCTMTVSDFVP